jgi:hypothetical protein
MAYEEVTIQKVEALPAQEDLVANRIYIVKSVDSTTNFDIYVTNNDRDAEGAVVATKFSVAQPQQDYIYATEEEFEADKANIPVGARVIKLYE